MSIKNSNWATGMEHNTYVINSPEFPAKEDFDKFNVWCEWHDADEIPYLKSLCSSEEELEERIVRPANEGKEIYYPLVNETKLSYRTFSFIKVEILIAEFALSGYAATVDEEVVSVTVWLAEDNEAVTLFRSDRLAAEDENPEAIEQLKQSLKISELEHIDYRSEYSFSNDQKIEGRFEFC